MLLLTHPTIVVWSSQPEAPKPAARLTWELSRPTSSSCESLRFRSLQQIIRCCPSGARNGPNGLFCPVTVECQSSVPSAFRTLTGWLTFWFAVPPPAIVASPMHTNAPLCTEFQTWHLVGSASCASGLMVAASTLTYNPSVDPGPPPCDAQTVG